MYSHCQNYYMVNMTMRPKMALWYLQITEKITTNWRIRIWSEFLRRIKLRRLFQHWQPFIPFALHLSKAMEAASSGYFHSSAQIKVIKNILCPLNLWSRSRKSLDMEGTLYFNLKSVYKWMFLYKCPLYDHSWPFFRHMCVCIFHKTEVLTVILRCLMGLNLDWVKSYGLKCSLRHRASSANSQKIATDNVHF